VIALVVQDAALKIVVVRGDVALVDAVNDVLDVALARCGQDHLGGARALQVLAEAFLVAPHAGVVDDQRILDAVLGVVDFRRRIGVDHMDVVAVGDDGVLVFIDRDRAAEGAMNGIAAQKAGAFFEIAFLAAAHDDGAQAHLVAGPNAFDHHAGQQASNAAETVKDNVLRLLQDGGFAGVDAGELLFNQGLGIAACFHVAVAQLAEVDAGGGEIHFQHRLDDLKALGNVQLLAGDLQGVAVGLDDLDGGVVQEPAAENPDVDAVVAVKVANQWDHLLGSGLLFLPVIEVIIHSRHADQLPLGD
jgi:hypothetical protein